MKAGATVYQGCLVAVDATGYAVNVTAATGLIMIGIAEKTVDNTAGSSGDLSVNVLCLQALFTNSGSDAVTQASYGSTVYAADNDTIAKTNGSSTLSAAGICTGVDSTGVWVSIGVGIV
jgi:hypothetical protein